jgi:hypothetical protein
MTRKNVSESYSKIQIEKVFLLKGPKTQMLENQGSDISVIQTNRTSPPPPKGQGWRKGGREAFNKTRNQSLEYDYSQKNYFFK